MWLAERCSSAIDNRECDERGGHGHPKLVAQMVKDLVAGSGIAFEDRGQVELKERAGAMTDVFASP